MSDLIDRQAAIEKISEIIWDTAIANDVKATLKELPSVQPEKRTEEHTETHACDCISRQAAIDEIKAVYEWHDVVTQDRLIEHLKEMPSVQPQRQTGKTLAEEAERIKREVLAVFSEQMGTHERTGHWITDKMPGEAMPCLVTVRRKKYTTTNYYVAFDYFIKDEVEGHFRHCDNVIAWMPLPEAYQEG